MILTRCLCSYKPPVILASDCFVLTIFHRCLNRRRFGLFVFHRAGTAAAISAAVRRAFFAARLHRTRAAFAAAIVIIAARSGGIIFSRYSLRSFIFHRAIVFLRAARSRRCNFARIVRFIKCINRHRQSENEHGGQSYQNFIFHFLFPHNLKMPKVLPISD